MCGEERTELDLHELIRRVLEAELTLAAEITACALADAGFGRQRNFLFAFRADARAFGKAEDVFGLDVTEDTSMSTRLSGLMRRGQPRAHRDQQRGRNRRAGLPTCNHSPTLMLRVQGSA